jgi:flagellar biosynthesis GTPase FlhF
LEQERWVGIRSGWLTAGCAVALLCVCILSGSAKSQEAASSNASSQQKAAGTKTVSNKPHAKASGATAKTTTPAKKPQAASHPAAAQHPKSNTAVAARNSKAQRVSSRKTTKKTAKTRGQQKIEPERAEAIQEALIREHYLSGEAAGTWDQASEDAMRKYQADHGWQSKTVPDARALISLGLGPNHDHLLNPESAMTTGPEGPHAASVSSTSQNPVSHSAGPGAPMDANPPAVPAGTPAHDSSSPQ